MSARRSAEATRAGVTLQSRVKIPPDVVFREVGDELVILDLTRGVYFGLNEVGTRAWRLLCEGRALDTAAATLAGEYDVSEGRCAADLVTFVGALLGHHLVELDAGADA